MKATVYRTSLPGVALMLYLTLWLSPNVNATPGDLDPKFDLTGGGQWSGLVGAGNCNIQRIIILPDEEIIVAGQFDSVDALKMRNVVRLEREGMVDRGFHSPFSSWGQVTAAAQYKDGNLLVGGYLPGGNGVLQPRLLLLTTNGTIDASFRPQLNDKQTILALAVDDQNRILVALSWYDYQPLMVRLLADGTVDTSFQIATPGYPAVSSIKPLPDGKILIAGSFAGPPMSLLRLNSDGSVDKSFNPKLSNGSLGSSVHVAAVQPDGKILIGGAFTQVGGAACTNLARVNADGTVDTNFNAGALVGVQVNDMVIQPDQKILITGGFTEVAGKTNLHGLARLLPDGSWDASFDVEPFWNASRKTVVVQAELDSSNRILISAIYPEDYTRPTPLIHRLLTNGAVDTTFSPPVAAGSATMESVAVEPDGSLCLSGAFTGVRDQFRNGFARVSATGAVLPGWEIPETYHGEGGVSVTLGDGSVVVGGTWQESTDLGCALIRFQPDGKLDPSWFYDSWSPDSMSVIHDMAVTRDGKILVVGMNRQGSSAIEQLLPNGRPDPDFHIPLIYGVDDIGVEKVLIQTNGYFIIIGEITSVDDVPALGFAQLIPNGNIVFSDDIFHGGIADMALQADGKVLFSGSFPSTNPGKVDVLQRRFDTLAIDRSLVLPDDLTGYANAVCVQPNGKILLGGSFQVGAGTNVANKRLIRLLPDGGYDPDFVQGVADDYIRTIAVAPDGTIVLGGTFTVYNGAAVSGVVCLIGDPVSPPAATRVLPAVARPGDTIRVSLQVNVPEGTTAFAVEETPPAAWGVAAVNNGGLSDPLGGKVHFPSAQTPLTYDVVVATNELTAVFTGTVAVNGTASVVAGASKVQVLGKYPADQPPADFIVTEAEVNFYADTWRDGRYWLGYGPGPNPIPQSYVSRAAYLWRSGTNYTVVTGSVLPPLCWTPVNAVPVPVRQGGNGLDGDSVAASGTRYVEHGFIEGLPLKVRLEVQPVSGTLAYTVEETLPAHWMPVAGSGDFAHDQNNSILKWGPFYDDHSRVLEYQVVPIPSARMRQPLHGAISCDGTDTLITGTTLLKRTCRMGKVLVYPGGAMSIETQGLGPASPNLEASDDLIHWTALPYQETDGGVISVYDPDNHGSQARFYRVRLD